VVAARAAELDPRHQQAIADQGARELARRSIPGTFAYFASCLLTILASSYGRDYPQVAFTVVAATPRDSDAPRPSRRRPRTRPGCAG
jgi:hypothetical protein